MRLHLMLRVVTCACVPHTGLAGGIPLALSFGVSWILPVHCSPLHKLCSFFQALGPVSHVGEVRNTGYAQAVRCVAPCCGGLWHVFFENVAVGGVVLRRATRRSVVLRRNAFGCVASRECCRVPPCGVLSTCCVVWCVVARCIVPGRVVVVVCGFGTWWCLRGVAWCGVAVCCGASFLVLDLVGPTGYVNCCVAVLHVFSFRVFVVLRVLRCCVVFWCLVLCFVALGLGWCWVWPCCVVWCGAVSCGVVACLVAVRCCALPCVVLLFVG